MTGYNGTTQTDGYSGDGLRAWKQAGSTKTYFLYDDDQPVCEYNSSGTLTATNTFGADGLVSRRNVSGSTTTFYTFDERGSVSQRLNSAGAVVSSDLYDGFGSRSSTGAADVWQFEAQAGYYTDAETGLILCTHRFYDPSSGRWLTRDPLGYDGGVNLYGYVGNDPTDNVDPKGLASIVEVDGGWFGSYSHAYIQFNMISCNSGPQQPGSKGGPSPGPHNSCGFWAFPGKAGSPGNQLGVVLSPDPDAPNGDPINYGGDADRKSVQTNNSIAFERALCACVATSKTHPGRFCVPGRVCGSWAHEMWDCATLRAGGGSNNHPPHPNPPHPGGGHGGGTSHS